MYFQALATDYDGTVAHDGVLDENTIAALERLRNSGRTLIMVTGRELDELKTVCTRLDLFDLVVAENGALLYDPKADEDTLLTQPPSADLVALLRNAGVPRISVGRSIIATWEPYETVVLESIRELGLELQIIFNKGAVMVLPASCNKATGLTAALERLKIPPEAVVGVGDAENDHAFIRFCGCGVAVANAIPALKDEADIVTSGERGAGVAELIDLLVASDLVEARRKRLARQKASGADGGFDEAHSFYFRGPEGALKLRAQTLPLFVQIGEGVDDVTWLHHLRAGDFSRWLREIVGDEALARTVAQVESDPTLDAAATRKAVSTAVRERIKPAAQPAAKAA